MMKPTQSARRPWDVNKALQVRAGTSNVLDKDPPVAEAVIVAGGAANTYGAYDLFDRQLFVAFTAKFLNLATKALAVVFCAALGLLIVRIIEHEATPLLRQSVRVEVVYAVARHHLPQLSILASPSRERGPDARTAWPVGVLLAD